MPETISPASNNRAVLFIDCPDQKGLVARVAVLLYEHHILCYGNKTVVLG
jgi:formyltetrahydrofolate hydrolase